MTRGRGLKYFIIESPFVEMLSNDVSNFFVIMTMAEKYLVGIFFAHGTLLFCCLLFGFLLSADWNKCKEDFAMERV